MSDLAGVVERLRVDAADGSLADLCVRLGVDLLVLFGSAVDDPSAAGDIDLAYGRLRGGGRGSGARPWRSARRQSAIRREFPLT